MVNKLDLTWPCVISQFNEAQLLVIKMYVKGAKNRRSVEERGEKNYLPIDLVSGFQA